MKEEHVMEVVQIVACVALAAAPIGGAALAFKHGEPEFALITLLMGMLIAVLGILGVLEAI